MQIVKQFLPVFIEYLEKNTFTKQPKELYDPVNYIMGLGGKRLRPLMVLAACDLFDTNYKEALPAAFAVEIFHNFSLVHDDIMDDAPLRRGKPTVHMLYDTNTAILSGDVMLILAYEYLCKTTAIPKIPRLLDLFNSISVKVCEGQQYDMNFEVSQEVSIEDYLKMIELKTAALLQGSLEIGALIGEAPQADFEELSAFGRKIGIAFQLQDDLLDTFGDAEKFGKQPGGDIIQNKKTYLILKAFEIAPPAVRMKLENLMNVASEDDQEKVKQVIQILEDLNIKEYIYDLIMEYKEQAMAHLDKIDVSDDLKRGLREFGNMIIERDF
jgi:geranylgeranyl diphosphate synthase type II